MPRWHDTCVILFVTKVKSECYLTNRYHREYRQSMRFEVDLMISLSKSADRSDTNNVGITVISIRWIPFVRFGFIKSNLYFVNVWAERMISFLPTWKIWARDEKSMAVWIDDSRPIRWHRWHQNDKRYFNLLNFFVWMSFVHLNFNGIPIQKPSWL